MNPLQQLALLAEALFVGASEEKKFFAPILSYITRLRAILTSEKGALTKQEIVFLGERIEQFMAQWRATGDFPYIPPAPASTNDATVSQIFSLTKGLNNCPDPEFMKALKQFSPAAAAPTQSADPQIKPRCVFIGHGRSKVWLIVKDFIEKDAGLPVVGYESEPRAGESIVPILEKMMDQATFAIIVMTAEDTTPGGGKRARQNVVHEAGLFQGRLGFTKAIVLMQRGCDDFSNIDGLQHLPFSDDNVKETFYDLQKVLKREKQC